VPITTTLDAVRLYIGDTDSDRPLLDDNEVQWLIDQRGGNALLAAADACEALAAHFAREPAVVQLDQGQQFDQGDRVEHYTALAKQLRTRAAGGINVMATVKQDGYTTDSSTRDGAGQAAPSTGRVLRGWYNGDSPV
jgi:hypothetical protein